MMQVISLLDTRILENLYALRDFPMVVFFIAISEFGTLLIIYSLSVAIVLLCIFYRHYAYAAGLSLSVATCGIVVLILKGTIERPRPPLSFQAYSEIWYSFPSAHAALSAALYFFLAYLAWKLIPFSLIRCIVIPCLFVLTFAIGFSRMYLGVHYASDVAAGLLLGTFCAWIGIRWVMFAKKS